MVDNNYSDVSDFEDDILDSSFDGTIIEVVRCADNDMDEDIEHFKVISRTIKIGSEEHLNNIVLDKDPSIEDEHVEIEYISSEIFEINPSGFYLTDLGSQEGTFVSIAKRELQEGDVYEIGGYEIKIMSINIAENKVGFMETIFYDETKIDSVKKRGLTKEQYYSSSEMDKNHSYIEAVVYKNGEAIREFIMFEGDYIGSSPKIPICLEETDKLDEVHCKLIKDDNRLCFVDNNSETGVWFRVSSPGECKEFPIQLEKDQMIRVGKVAKYRFEVQQ